MTLLRRLLLALLTLLPLVALVHKNDLGRWDVARSAMAAPDEFSYLLLADSLLHGHGVHLAATIGRDTFYPPGYPALLALFCLPTGRLTLFAAHLFNALVLCACVPLAAVVAGQILRRVQPLAHRRYRLSEEGLRWTAVGCAAAFAVNWHVLEGALFVFSEPAFTLVTLGWIALGLRWRNWPVSPLQTLVIASLAMAAYTIRGAGLVCVGATLLYPLIHWAQSRKRLPARAVSLLLIIVLAGVTKVATHYTDNAPNSYPHQLLNGITHGGVLSLSKPRDWPALVLRGADLAASHLDDDAESFTPIARVEPDLGPLSYIGKVFAMLALAGWATRLLARRSETRFLDLYLLFYGILYLLWPFNMARFWTPVLPLMLPYAIHALRLLSSYGNTAWGKIARWLPVAALGLLVVLHAEELTLHLGPYQSRLNYVSDALAQGAGRVLKNSTNPGGSFLCVEGGDEFFIFSWYLAHPPQGTPLGQVRVRTTKEGQRIETLLMATAAEAAQTPGSKVFIVSYFDESLFQEVFANLRREQPAFMASHRLTKIYQKGIEVNLWELSPTVAPR